MLLPVDCNEHLEGAESWASTEQSESLWEMLLVPVTSAGNAASTRSSNSLCCSLICALSSCVAADVEVVDTDMDTEEAAGTGLGAAQTGVDDGLGVYLTMNPRWRPFGSRISRDIIFTGKHHL